MTAVFADTLFYIALLLEADSRHVRATQLSSSHRGEIVTTAWVIMELGSYFSSATLRGALLQLSRVLQSSPGVWIVPPSAEDFEAGLALFSARPDKSWSLVDCISFHVMREKKITDSWTTDHHFEQAGFKALLI